MKIGFIGCGNMATAIIDGVIKSGCIDCGDIYIYDINKETVNSRIEKYKVNACKNEAEAVKLCDAVVLAVKPNVLTSVLEKINIALTESDTLIISIAAGKTIEFIRNTLSHGNRIIRVMPNINATVGVSMTAYTANSNATESDKALCEKIFGSVGEIIELDEKQFPVFGVIGGCAPAFAYMFIDSLARAAVKNGMSKDTALKTAAQTVLGSAEMILKSKNHPWELVDKVCSPGGTTIEGVTSLQNDGFETAIHNAVDRAIAKDSKL
ncbi:MAG: pyrroline-5-carboxylate reductase [Eubacterium sp.]|nr:pyrroline-5-carboxylate reductase [Eubacterium sp.]